MGAPDQLNYERRLAAIMFTDLVGYSALTHSDEAGSMRAIALHGRIARECAARHDGTVIKTTGDGFLIEFASLLKAVECGLDILRAHADSDASTPAAERIRLRIGIHVGEIVGHENDIYGDGVNIAARIQSIAPANSVAFSRQVYDQVRNKLAVPVIELGRLELKNIRTPVFGYAVVPEGAPAPRPVRRRPVTAPLFAGALVLTALAAGAAATLAWTPLLREGISRNPASAARRIAILPFTRLTRETGDEFLADGLVEELITRLAGVPGLKVVARSSVNRLREAGLSVHEIAESTHAGLVLEGSLRRAGSAVRISIKLVDVRSEEIQWAEDFDTASTGVLHLEERVADQVVSHLSLSPLPQASAAARAAADPEAPENRAQLLYLKGRYAMSDRSRKGLLAAIEQFRQALTIRPQHADAYVGLAHAYELLGFYGYLETATAMKEQLKFATRALELAPNNAEAHLAMAENLTFLKRDWKAAEKEYLRALELDPDNATARHWYSGVLSSWGRHREAIEQADRSVALEPDSLTIRTGAGWTRMAAGDVEGAIRQYRHALGMDASFIRARTRLANAEIHAGRGAEALKILRAAPRGSATEDVEYRVTLLRALAATGQRDEAERIDRELTEAARTTYVPTFFLARARMALGDPNGALRLLRQAADERSALLVSVRVDPDFAPLRGRPEFDDLLRRVGLL